MKPMPGIWLFLLAAVPALAAGKPFPALMDELVLKPVGMERSTFLNPLPPTLLKHAAAGYLPDHSAVEGKRHTYPEMAAAGEYGWAGYAPYPKLELPQEALDLYPGRYRYNAETAFAIERRGDRLFMQFFGGKAHELHNVGEGRYMRRERSFPITFTVEDSVATFHFVNLDDPPQSHRRMADDERAPREILIAEGFEKALPVYRTLFEQSPDDPAVSERWLNGQGLGMAAGERYEPAIGLLRIATVLYPDSANTWDSVSYVYRQMGRPDSALEWYRKALEVDPDFASAVKAVAELEAERASTVEAIVHSNRRVLAITGDGDVPMNAQEGDRSGRSSVANTR